MNFGRSYGGIPFFLNGSLFAWVCRTVDGKYTYFFTGSYICQDFFYSEKEAKLDLIKCFGE